MLDRMLEAFIRSRTESVACPSNCNPKLQPRNAMTGGPQRPPRHWIPLRMPMAKSNCYNGLFSAHPGKGQFAAIIEVVTRALSAQGGIQDEKASGSQFRLFD